MTPKLPPPPLSPQNRSAFSSSLAVTTSPEAVTSSAEMMLSQAKPSFRSSQPLPLPVVKPATPVVVTRPPVTASPCSCVTASNAAQLTPPSARAVRFSGSTVTLLRFLRSRTMPSSTLVKPATE